jgi:flagellar hook-length control protein FliK
MQTQSIQNQPTNKLQPPKSAPLPSDDFKGALALEMERMPVCAAPEQAAPAQPQARAPVKNAQPAKPAQPSQNASQASAADEASGTDAAPPADGKPVAATAEASGGADKGAEEGADDTAAATDPAAGMLAMLAAYGQLTARVEAKPEPSGTATGTGKDAAALAALQADASGKPTLAELAADARAGKAQAEGMAALQDGGDALPKAGAMDAEGHTKAAAFDAQMAAQLNDTTPQPVAQPAAQALAATMQAANAVAASQLQARVGTSAWEQQLGQKVVWMVAGGDQSASLTLNPPDLGPLQVVLSVSNDSATATFTAHQPETRQAIENALPKLREMMSEAGIALGDASVSAGSQEQQQAFAEQARASARGGRFGDGGAADRQDEAQPVIRRTVLGAVDTFA